MTAFSYTCECGHTNHAHAERKGEGPYFCSRCQCKAFTWDEDAPRVSLNLPRPVAMDLLAVLGMARSAIASGRMLVLAGMAAAVNETRAELCRLAFEEEVTA